MSFEKHSFDSVDAAEAAGVSSVARAIRYSLIRFDRLGSRLNPNDVLLF